jgi:hypothetical protein
MHAFRIGSVTQDLLIDCHHNRKHLIDIMLLGAELLALSVVLSTGLLTMAAVQVSTTGAGRGQPNPAGVDLLLFRRRSQSRGPVRCSSRPSSLASPRGLRVAERARGTSPSRTPSTSETDLASPSDHSAGGQLGPSEKSPNTQLHLKLSHLFRDDEEASENLALILGCGANSRKSQLPSAPDV